MILKSNHPIVHEPESNGVEVIIRSLTSASERKTSRTVRTPRSIAVFIICVLCFFWIVTLPAWGAEIGALRIGVAKVDITPTDLTGLTSQWGQPLVGVHDPIFVRALVLDNGTNTAAIVSADLIEFGDTVELRTRIAREVGIPADHLIIAATHDHSAPKPSFTATGRASATGAQAFTLNVYDKVVDALKQAKVSLQQARVGIGTGTADVNINRDEYDSKGWHLGVNPDRQSDKTVWVVKFETPSGDPIAVLFDYAVHSVVAGPATDQLTGDLAGAAERYVEQHYKNKVVALFVSGAAGDQNPTFTGPGERPEENVPVFQAIDAQGLMLGAETVRVSNRIDKMTTAAHIAAAERTISCPAKPPTQLHPDPQQQSASLPIHLGLIMVNQIAFTAVSGEVVTNIYWNLKKASPLADTIMIALSNGRVGYIVDDATYDTPIFELGSSPLARGCAENGIVNNLVEMINQNR
jgi:neutral ceramidase